MLEVIKPGVQLCIQDLGRHGHRHLGVSQSGALDPLAVKIANTLLGNPLNTAVLEITVGLTQLQFTSATNFALTGGDLKACLDDTPLTPGWRYYAKPGQLLSFASSPDALRAYVSVEGGFDVQSVMGSCATDLQAGFGGINGLPLAAGDQLHYSSNTERHSVGALQPGYHKQVRILSGPHCTQLDSSAAQLLSAKSWQVLPDSNRMGMRLTGPDLITHQLSINSQAVLPGTIQLPPNGAPIVLLNDCQTTGGYPMIAQVIQADLRHFAQLSAGDQLSFALTTAAQAYQETQQQNYLLNQLRIALTHHDRSIS
ncbi:biotin-dependent carboxyltransferase family protein [Pseudoalteromonas sp. DL2-H2.2]|uniref:5-oxoprolinase subunit C family protein n=1 Tax=Pseudoalteromonas sp. DL2-H2.2 TaxID=2908889 RepID=UPI001F1C082B|nr:biotin-dependent carboxyltransferase family protein [Pseudoalteromonas sp. DL2-H2.2]MCF2909089.1 biotin-dependent carboxyltransferase family protein [Pseudoalteromonas sp. DL2-H2.2]